VIGVGMGNHNCVDIMKAKTFNLQEIFQGIELFLFSATYINEYGSFPIAD